MEDLDLPDPATGLTPREKDLVRKNWDDIISVWKKNGPEFFIRLFTDYPKIKSYFKPLEGLSADEMRAAPKVKAHALNFKHGISSFIESLDEPEILIDLIQKVAKNHFRRMIAAPLFEDAFQSFLNFAASVSEMDEPTKEAWIKTLKVVGAVIAAHMETLAAGTNGDEVK